MKNKVKICGHIYKVVAHDDDSDGKVGTTSFANQEIKISLGPTIEIQEETFIHEFIHCVDFHASERDWNEHPESLIQAIANGLWQAGIRPKHFNVELPSS